jgi:hypothetical protein
MRSEAGRDGQPAVDYPTIYVGGTTCFELPDPISDLTDEVIVQSSVFKAAGAGPRHHGHAGFRHAIPGPGHASCGQASSGCASQIQPSAQ